MNKKYYCEYCRKYPNQIIVTVEGERILKWNGQEYKLIKTETEEDQYGKKWCKICGAWLLEIKGGKSH